MISGLFKKKVKGALVLGALLVGGSSYAQLGLTWSEMGPNDIAGRCRSIIIDKTVANGSRIYAAGVSGGVFTSTNSAGTWMPLNDQSASLIISCMTQASDGTIYAGTGETYTRGGDGAGLSGFIGTGLYKFTPGTNTLVLVKDSSTFGNINEVAVDPNNVSKIYVAGEKGFFASVDGGATFFKEVSTGTVPAMDVKVAIDGGVYFASGSKASMTSKVYYSATGALATYTNMAVPSLTTTASGGSGRIEIALSPSNPNYVYVSVAKSFTLGSTISTGGLNSIWTSNDKGVTWKILSYGTAQFDPLSSSTSSGFGDYCHTLVVDPSNPGSVFLGGYTVYNWRQNTNLAFGLGTWVQIGNELAAGSPLFVHSKAHDIKFLPTNTKQYYIATDGGIFKTVSLDNATFYPTAFLAFNNGLNISQFNSVAFQNFPKNIAAAGSPTANPAAGAVGGTIGNGACYLPGNFLNSIQTSVAFGSSDTYQADFSKLIPKALFFSTAFGAIQRTSDIGTVPMGTFYDPSYLGGSATTGNRPGNSAFANENTPMRLWENYGLTAPADYAIFYNAQIKNSFVNVYPSKGSFTVAITRPQSSAKYDTITVTATSFKKDSINTHRSYTITNTAPMEAFTSFTNTSTTLSTFTVNNTRPSSAYKYAYIIVQSFSMGVTNPAVNRSFTLTPIYTGTAVTGVVSTGTATPNSVTINPSLTDNIQFTLDSIPGDTSLIEVYFKYIAPTTFTLANNRPTALSRYEMIEVKSTSTKLIFPPPVQTFSIIPNYNISSNPVPVSYSFMGTGANTATFTNNLIFQNTSLSDSLHFTFNTAPDDSSVITVKIKLKYAQSIQITPVYTGNNITSCNVIGQASLTPSTNNYVYPLSSLTDSIRFTFSTLPGDSTTIATNVKLKYSSGSYITMTNSDISGRTFRDSLLLGGTLFWNSTPPTVKIPLKISARLAVGINGSIYAVKKPLNFSINPDWVRIVGKNSRIDGPGGLPTSTVVAALVGTVTKLEWAPNGRSLYFSTKYNDTTYYLYRTSHLDFLGDSSASDYSGFFSSDLDSVNKTGSYLRKSVTQRTTPLGRFKYPITSISVRADNMGIIVTTGGYKNKLATVYTSNGADVRTLNMNNTDNTTNFTSKNGTGLPLFPAYSSLFEMNDNKRVLIGTEKGIYSTTDITQASPTWVPENTGFPNVPVFQIRQQTVPNYLCYNSGEIYVATHGRGIWSTNKYLSPFAIGITEQEKNTSFASNIRLYPNPASDNANVWFNAEGDASYKITVYDVSGRIMIQENTPKLNAGEQNISINTTSLNSGVYFVSVNGTNNFNANVKFVISK